MMVLFSMTGPKSMEGFSHFYGLMSHHAVSQWLTVIHIHPNRHTYTNVEHTTFPIIITVQPLLNMHIQRYHFTDVLFYERAITLRTSNCQSKLCQVSASLQTPPRWISSNPSDSLVWLTEYGVDPPCVPDRCLVSHGVSWDVNQHLMEGELQREFLERVSATLTHTHVLFQAFLITQSQVWSNLRLYIFLEGGRVCVFCVKERIEVHQMCLRGSHGTERLPLFCNYREHIQ